MNEEISAQDRLHLARALELAARGLYTTDPNPRVGCVIANGDNVLGEGWHVRAGEAHAAAAAASSGRNMAMRLDIFLRPSGSKLNVP